MSKQFALFDFDNTLYDGFSLLGVLDAQVQSGLVGSDIPAKIKQTLSDHEAGKMDYETMAQTQLEMYAASLKGVPYDDVFQSALSYFRQTDHIFPFARPVIELLDETHETALVTALPEPAAKAAAAVLGVTGVYCSTYEIANQRFTGAVDESLAGRNGKHAAVQRIGREHSMENSLVFGDSEGDMEMLAAAGHAICVNPSAGLKAEADKHGWHICTPDTVEQTVRGLLAQA